MAEKKGLIYRLTMGSDNLPDFTPNKLPGSRWAVFKDVFTNRLGAMAKISLLTALFCIPAIVWIIIMYMAKSVDATLIPYSSNIGIGYPVVTNAALIGEYRTFMYTIQEFIFFIPALMIASLGFAGAFHTMKLLAWGEGVSIGGTFFQGIKKNWAHFLWIFLILGLSLFTMAFNIAAAGYSALEMNEVLKTISLVLSIVQFVFVLCMMIFLCGQEVTYKLKFFHLFKNSVLMAFALIPQNLFFIILSAIPIVIVMILPISFALIGWLVIIILGPAYVVLIWTCYSQWVFDKFINDKVKGAVKQRGMYVKNPEAEKAAEIERIKTRNVVYGAAYVSRRLSSIDKGVSFTPLATNFSRADLAKLGEEKQRMSDEIDREKAEIETQLEEELRIYEEAQAAEKKKGKKKKKDAKPEEMTFVEYKKKDKKKKKKISETDIATMPVSTEEYKEDDE